MFPPQDWNLTDLAGTCHSLFGVQPRPSWMPNSMGMAKGLEGLAATTSHVIFTNGLLDPWSSQSVTKNASDTLVAINLPDGSHHSDLGAPPNPTISSDDSSSLKAARATQLQILRQWLDELRRTPSLQPAPVPLAGQDAKGDPVLHMDSNPVAVTQLELSDWASALRNGTIDALIDVRTPEEFGAQWGAVGFCISASDPHSCDYGHVAGAYWLPNLHLMSDADFISNMSGTQDPAGLQSCAGLRLAFICHSGVRSNTAAEKLQSAYLTNGITKFDGTTLHGGAILNAGGGTQAYYEAGLLTHYGFARAQWPGCIKLSKFVATWNETAPV
mmetsp:Transcript_42978/g.112917  ORF Transcript_42978/g.112917 Transcript_42978/m.112917 type:complete len:329 (-) Transcript_42978:236-1222(-)